MNKKKNLVKKSNDWIERVEALYGLNKAQLKIIAKLSTMVNRNDEDFKEYRFNIRTLLKELRLGEENYRYLDKITLEMAGKVADVYNNGVRTQTGLITAQYPDKEGVLILSFHKSLKPYFLQLKGSFTTYELYYFLSLKGKHSMRLYELLKLYEFTGKFEKSVKFLRKYFNIEKGRYKQFCHFNKKVINESIEDIEANTDIEIEYKFIKKGKKVTGYQFWILEKGTKEQRKKALPQPPSSKVLFQGDDQRDIELESLKFANRELEDVMSKIAFYEHYRRTGDEIKIAEAKEELPKLAKKKRVLEKNIKELEDEISKRK